MRLSTVQEFYSYAKQEQRVRLLVESDPFESSVFN